MLTYKEQIYENNDNSPDSIEVIIAKNDHGPAFSVKYEYENETGFIRSDD